VFSGSTARNSPGEIESKEKGLMVDILAVMVTDTCEGRHPTDFSASRRLKPASTPRFGLGVGECNSAPARLTRFSKVFARLALKYQFFKVSRVNCE